MTKYHALLLAGSRPGGDPFAKRYGAELKALIPIAGEPMVLRPLRALLACRRIAAVRLLTQEPDQVAAVLPDSSRWSVEPSSGTIAETLETICNAESARWPMLVTTADHAVLAPRIAERRRRRSVEQDRKKGWRLLLALGWPGLLGLLRLRTLDQTLAAMGRKLGLSLRAVRLDDALAAVDVDKPQDYELVTAILERRA